MRLTIRQLGIATAMGAAAVSAFASGWWRDDNIARPATNAANGAPEWKLPKPMIANLEADARILVARRPFGAAGDRPNNPAGGATGAGGVGAGSATAVQWRISGIVTSETSRYLVVLLRPPGQNSDRTELRQVGESLPDGGVVRSVDTSSVTIDHEGMVATVRMFEKN